MSRISDTGYLHRLAHLYGVQTAYYDVIHRRKPAARESLLAVLKSLGCPLAALGDAPSAYREAQTARWRQLLEPVITVWDGKPSPVELRLPRKMARADVECHLSLESGGELAWRFTGADLKQTGAADLEGMHYVTKELPLPDGLPMGYHKLRIVLLEARAESFVISAPSRVYSPPDESGGRMWGIFLPLYALHTKRSWGGGDLSDLSMLMDWMAGQGGRLLATLPLLPVFQDVIYEPSPYLPISRRLWNELYLDIHGIPELGECPEAMALVNSPGFKSEIDALRGSTTVDYRRQMALKRRVLEELSRFFFGRESQRNENLRRFVALNPVVKDYAFFRAALEKYRFPWQYWPAPLRDGNLKDFNYDTESCQYHFYTQWLIHRQMESLSQKAEKEGVNLSLDFPVGVHPDGYDVWRERDAFAIDTAAGSPPDTVFIRGQTWDFPPLHPERIRQQGYRYVIECLRHHLRQAGVLRIDHVMWFHRMFCIPKGMEPAQGVYLRYRPDELYAILALESHRSKTVIIGEDLGTVPGYVRPTMNKHGVQRMYILHYELASIAIWKDGLPLVSADSVAAINTHDMPPFAAFCQGLDIEQRLKLGILNKMRAEKEKRDLVRIKGILTAFLKARGFLKKSENDIFDVLKACLSLLAAGKARMVLVNLEDLWLETEPHNIPSTKNEYPNWQRKTRYSFEEFRDMTMVLDTLRTVNELRGKIGE